MDGKDHNGQDGHNAQDATPDDPNDPNGWIWDASAEGSQEPEEEFPEGWPEDFGWNEEGVPIPGVLHSLYLDGPFKQCVECDIPLAELDGLYGVQKVIRNGEAVMEFALCDACHDRMQESCSKESLERLALAFEERAVFTEGLDACAFCLRSRETFREHNLQGRCHGDRMHFSLCICLDCLMELNELVSKKTRDARDDFVNRNFPGVPAGSDVPVYI